MFLAGRSRRIHHLLAVFSVRPSVLIPVSAVDTPVLTESTTPCMSFLPWVRSFSR